MKLALVLAVLVSSSRAGVVAPIIEKESKKYDLDPLLVSAVIYHESRFQIRACYKGAHGLMQVQLERRSCDKRAVMHAKKLRLYKPRVNIRKGTELMSFWKNWKEKNNPDDSYHWLLHYNQGFGKCNRGRKRCMPRTSGKYGQYAERVMKIYKRLRKASRNEV